MNSFPLSHCTMPGHGYRVIHVTSIKWAMVSARLSGISTISNHPVAGSIIVKQCSVKVDLPLRSIWYGPIRSIHSTSQAGSTSASLGGNLPYFFLIFFVNWHVWHLPHMRTTPSWSFGHVKCCRIVISVRLIPGWHNWLWYHSTTCFCSFVGTTILSLCVIKS